MPGALRELAGGDTGGSGACREHGHRFGDFYANAAGMVEPDR
jgi:hypothetical protein